MTFDDRAVMAKASEALRQLGQACYQASRIHRKGTPIRTECEKAMVEACRLRQILDRRAK